MNAAPPHDPALYVHVPFCARTCDFCAFYQVRPEGDAIPRYLDDIDRELELAGLGSGPGISTVFWGGGTPGLLTPESLGRLARAVHRAAGPHPPAEWTVELAPTTVRADRLQQLRSDGVTRVSMGVQSFQPHLLDALGRPHARSQVDRAWELVRSAGFASVSLDLIFGAPGQTADDWRADLAEAVLRAPDHLSTYCLTFEEDTALYLRMLRGQARPDDATEADFQEIAHDVLTAAGYHHYEVSNYARPGHECRHNLATWRMGSWIGLGPAAASQHAGWRAANPPDLARWSADLATGLRATADRTPVDSDLLALDRVVFGLRLAEGFDLADPALAPRREAIESALRPAIDTGLLLQSGSRLRPSARGFLFADRLATEVLEAAETSPRP